MPKRKTQTKSSVPWWLDGDEECPHCHQVYAYELEVRCAACDGPGCPHCVTRVKLGVVCVACSDSPEIAETADG